MFVIPNTGRQAFDILSVDPVRGCIAALMPTEHFEPGQSATIGISVDTNNFKYEPLHETVSLALSTRTVPITLHVRATIPREVQVSRKSACSGPISLGQAATSKETLIVIKTLPHVIIRGVESTHTPVPPTLLRGTHTPELVEYNLRLKCRPESRAQGLYFGTIQIKLSHSRKSEIAIPFRVMAGDKRKPSELSR